ncbi:MAG: hypothetical protein GC136_08995 [Alphaproteobacteria bacterium]|nr:hypothetical protein [Alphaproteobacteria bacterium]
MSANVSYSTPVIELLSSRICHDLISPIGAIVNGLEFMEDMDGADSEEALELITHSAKLASAKLKLFRIIYGAGGRDGVKPADVHKALEDWLTLENKIRQTWQADAVKLAMIPEGFCKLMAGTLLMATECLPKGGTLNLVQKDDKIEISASGENANLRDGVADALSLKLAESALDPRLTHPYIMGKLAQSYGYSLTSKPESGTVTFVLAQMG